MSRVTAKEEDRILTLGEIRVMRMTGRIEEVDIPVKARIESPVGPVNLIGFLRIDNAAGDFNIESGRERIRTPVKPNGDGRHVFIEDHRALLFLRRPDGEKGRAYTRLKQ